MYVRNGMTSNPYVISPETSLSEAFALMKDKKVRRMPVVKQGKLVGIVTDGDLLAASPSSATTLSVYEINYLLGKTTVESIMSKDVVSVSPDNLLEEAALLMRNHRIGGLPVVEEGHVVGIITETDIFDSFIELMGFRDHGSRIAIDIPEDKPGLLAQISTETAKLGISITHLAVLRNELVIRVNTTNTEELENQLARMGFALVSVLKTE